VRLSSLSLERKEKFKLVVVLREPDDTTTGEITKDVMQAGHLVGVGSGTRRSSAGSPGRS
jgi:phosphate transport system substrate-binding protein